MVPHLAVVCYTFMFAVGPNWKDSLRLLAIVAVGGLLLHIPAYLRFQHWQKNILRERNMAEVKQRNNEVDGDEPT